MTIFMSIIVSLQTPKNVPFQRDGNVYVLELNRHYISVSECIPDLRHIKRWYWHQSVKKLRITTPVKKVLNKSLLVVLMSIVKTGYLHLPSYQMIIKQKFVSTPTNHQSTYFSEHLNFTISSSYIDSFLTSKRLCFSLAKVEFFNLIGLSIIS